MVPGFSKQHLCNRDLTKIRVPEIRGHYPQDSRLPNPYLAKVRGKQRASQPLHDTRKTPPHRGAGYAIVPEPPSRNVTRFAQWRYRAPSGRASRSIFSATREAAGVRAAWSPPFQSPPYDHADRATLGRRDAKASRRTRRPEPKDGFPARSRKSPTHNDFLCLCASVVKLGRGWARAIPEPRSWRGGRSSRES